MPIYNIACSKKYVQNKASPILWKNSCQKSCHVATAMIAIIVQQIGNIFRGTPSIGTLLITNHLEEFWVGVSKLL